MVNKCGIDSPAATPRCISNHNTNDTIDLYRISVKSTLYHRPALLSSTRRLKITVGVDGTRCHVNDGVEELADNSPELEQGTRFAGIKILEVDSGANILSCLPPRGKDTSMTSGSCCHDGTTSGNSCSGRSCDSLDGHVHKGGNASSYRCLRRLPWRI